MKNTRRSVRRTRWGIVGAGRAAGALATALGTGAPDRAPVVRVWARRPSRARALARRPGVGSTTSLGRLLAGCEVILLAVEDDALEAITGRLAAEWPAEGPRVVLHLAGARPTTVLEPLAALGVGVGVFHPVVALAGPSSARRLAGATATVSGSPRGVEAAEDLCRRLGLEALIIEDQSRPLVHLAAVLAAGDLVALLGLAEDLLALAGVAGTAAQRLLAALARSAVEGYERDGPEEAITGPVARADLETLRAHWKAAEAQGPAGRRALEVHRLLSLEGAGRLARSGRLGSAALRRLRRLLGSPQLAAPRRRP